MGKAFPNTEQIDIKSRTTALNDYFLINSYASLDIFDNLGSTFLFLLVFFFVHLIAPLVKKAASKYKR